MTLKAKLIATFLILSIVSGLGFYAYTRYLDYKKEQEILIRNDERSIVQSEVNTKTAKELQAEKKKVKDLQRQLSSVYAEIDKRADEKLSALRNAKTEEELNSAYEGVIKCLEKSC